MNLSLREQLQKLQYEQRQQVETDKAYRQRALEQWRAVLKDKRLAAAVIAPKQQEAD